MASAITSVFLGLTVMIGATAVSIWVLKACCGSCNHSYERIDGYNNKKIILVCSKCGKIKKIRK